MGAVEGSEKGCQRDRSLGCLGSTGEAGSQGGGLPTLCPHQTLSSQWVHLPTLELWGITRLATKPQLDGQKWADPCLHILYPRGSAPGPFGRPGLSLTTTMSLLSLPSYRWLCHDVWDPRGCRIVTRSMVQLCGPVSPFPGSLLMRQFKPHLIFVLGKLYLTDDF